MGKQWRELKHETAAGVLALKTLLIRRRRHDVPVSGEMPPACPRQRLTQAARQAHIMQIICSSSPRAPIGNTENNMYIWSKQANNCICSGGRPSDEPLSDADGETTDPNTRWCVRHHLILICIWNNLCARD